MVKVIYLWAEVFEFSVYGGRKRCSLVDHEYCEQCMWSRATLKMRQMSPASQVCIFCVSEHACTWINKAGSQDY